MVDKNFCMSSYIAFRYIFKENVDFYENMFHSNYRLPDDKDKTYVWTAEDIDKEIQKIMWNVYSEYSKVGILLSGGMDSAILASYLKPGSYAYTFVSKDSDVYNVDIERARKYCGKYGLIHRLVDISFDDYKKYTPIVMERKCAPVHSIEPQIYKAAVQAKEDDVELMIIGDGADYVFGGMDKLLSKDWKYDEFVRRYITLNPELVLNNPVNMNEMFEPYRINENDIDFQRFLKEPTTIESYGSYENPFACAGMKYCDPYMNMAMADELDLNRIRNGESKYLIRELYKIKYPEYEVPTKIPMPRPVDMIFIEWLGPTRAEFRRDIPMEQLTGNQKWQLYCLEMFLNIHED